MSAVIQSRIQYTFANDQLLSSALKSAHRDKDGDAIDDGNRGLAHYGNLAMQMAEAHEAIVENGKTLHDIHTRNHWSQSKKGRAQACRSLGIEPFIEQSIRQRHQSPSDTVLDHALSALLGAVWLDCERQNQTTAATRGTILNVLRSIDAIVDVQSSSKGSETQPLKSTSNQSRVTTDHSEPQYSNLDLSFGQELGSIDEFINDWFQQEFGGISQTILDSGAVGEDLRDFTVEAEGRLSPRDNLTNDPSELVPITSIPRLDSQVPVVRQQQSDYDNELYDTQRDNLRLSEPQNVCSATPVTNTKRKWMPDKDTKLISAYRSFLQSELQKLTKIPQHNRQGLARYLEHRKLDRMETGTTILPQFLYLAIGSWQTISDYRDLLRRARCTSNVLRHPNVLAWSAADTYNEICRLDQEEALTVLLRRYHTIKLCAENQPYDDDYGRIIVQTPDTVGLVETAIAGNPIYVRDARLTDQLVLKILPDTQPGSAEFIKARRRVKRLRKLARYLSGLVQTYGFGILALLPSGPSFGELSLTDTTLTSITEKSFDTLAQLLYQEQGALLQNLSRAIEPSLLALVQGGLECHTTYLAERVDPSLLIDLPKGLLHLEWNCSDLES